MNCESRIDRIVARRASSDRRPPSVGAGDSIRRLAIASNCPILPHIFRNSSSESVARTRKIVFRIVSTASTSLDASSVLSTLFCLSPTGE